MLTYCIICWLVIGYISFLCFVKQAETYVRVIHIICGIPLSILGLVWTFAAIFMFIDNHSTCVEGFLKRKVF